MDPMINHSPFMKSVRDIIRAKPMALATEKTYCYWIRFFIRHQSYKSRGDINPVDVTGAGDSMLISSAMIMAVGGNIWEAALIGSLA